MVTHQRVALRPSAVVVLAFDEEVYGPAERFLEDLFLFLQIDSQQKLSTMLSGLIVEGSVAVIMLKLLQPPCLSADGGIPGAE